MVYYLVLNVFEYIIDPKTTLFKMTTKIQRNIAATWWRHQVRTFSALLALCAGNSPVTDQFPAQKASGLTVNSPHKGPVTRSFDGFFDLSLNKRLSKQSWDWWFETPSCPLWRHCNDLRVDPRDAGAKIFRENKPSVPQLLMSLMLVSHGDLLYWHGLILIPAWISNHMPCKVWDEITYPFPNFNGAAVEVWEWINNFIPRSIMDVITYPCGDLS